MKNYDPNNQTTLNENTMKSSLIPYNSLMPNVDIDAIKDVYTNKFGMLNGYCKWELTIDWLCMSNDDFFELYKFSYIPSHKLKDLAWETREKLVSDKTEKSMTLQINPATNAIFNQLSNPLRLVKNNE